MNGNLFLIHWNEAEAKKLAKPLRAAGWKVKTESADGARAGKLIKAKPPDVLVIYLKRLPSHGRETAHALRSMKATRPLPIVFVDGEGEPLAKTRAKVPDAIYTNSAELMKVLSQFAKRDEEE
jgi:CheY-like chemotaxis protein